MNSNKPNSPSESTKERRQHLRTKAAIEVELLLENQATPLRAKTADLSPGGCYLDLMFTFEVGTKLKLVLWTNDAKLTIDCVVVTRDLQVGNGIKFLAMTPEDTVKLQKIIASRPDVSPRTK
jgi:c-di-GMP-binding flagellar brake protein YcgR